MLPNYMVIGAAKCGTTSICDLLGAHPDVFMTHPKEPAFFSHRKDPSKNWNWYKSLFAGVTKEIAIGEGSTAYTHPDVIYKAAEGIAAAIPQCRLIYMVRHPLKRLESDWRMRRRERWTPASINVAVREQANLVRHGLYWRNLSTYRQFFPDEQILILFLEDFSRSPEAALRRCCSHLGVRTDVDFMDPQRPRNRAEDKRADGAIAARLRRWGGFEEMKRHVPRWLVNAGKATLTRERTFAAQWDPEVYGRVVHELAEDAETFLAHCGKPPDFWKFDATP